jgi:hypothetical protein
MTPSPQGDDAAKARSSATKLQQYKDFQSTTPPLECDIVVVAVSRHGYVFKLSKAA